MPDDKDDVPARPQSTERCLHRALQKFTDRHRRPRKLAKNPVVFGQEPGRDLFESREQRLFLLTAISVPRTPRTRPGLGHFAPAHWRQHWMRRGTARARAARPSAP